LIHNHPGSGPFSSADLGVFSFRDVTGIVVSKEYVYKITPIKGNPKCPWGKSLLVVDDFKATYAQRANKYSRIYSPKAEAELAPFKKAWTEGRLPWEEYKRKYDIVSQELSNRIQHEVLTELSKDWGFTYERIPVSEAGMNLPPVLEAITRKGNVPITTYLNPATLSDPVKYKSIYLRKMFNGDKELYNFFVELYKKAGEEGAFFPINIAWIRFREVYVEVEEGWEKK